MKITTCSVTVMRSHDYCHFSVTLSADLGPESIFNEPNREEDKLTATDTLRKSAARLADKAVEQYKIKKQSIADNENSWSIECMKDASEEAQAVAEPDRTPEQTAIIKAYMDRCHRLRYDYEDPS